MSYDVIWYADALSDLEQIYDYYRAKNPRVAERIYLVIINETLYLKNHPHIAPVETYLADKGNFRSMVTKDGLFKIIYYVRNKEIFIVRIWSCRQDIRNLTV